MSNQGWGAPPPPPAPPPGGFAGSFGEGPRGVHFVGPGSSWSGRHLEVVTGAGGAWYATSHRRPRNRGIGVSHGRM